MAGKSLKSFVTLEKSLFVSVDVHMLYNVLVNQSL